VSLPVSIPI